MQRNIPGVLMYGDIKLFTNDKKNAFDSEGKLLKASLFGKISE